ncbi:tetratricopeptide repeat protein [Candidatus Sumerlaeota bacterium]|nr:tetratricopeptide repeat protein [Candidatus Sumerlaeota bacterium]
MRRSSEKFNRAVQKLLDQHDFGSIEATNNWLQSLIEGKTIDDIVKMAGLEDDPYELSQDLFEQAMSAKDYEEKIELLTEAMLLDPANIDVKIELILETSFTERKTIRELNRLAREAESQFGEDFFQENEGHFWGVLETRPYMRAREALAYRLYGCGRTQEAIDEYKGMLRLNPNDNQGVREYLLAIYLEEGMIDEARQLLDRYKETTFAVYNYGKVLEAWLSDELKQAEELLKFAMSKNPHLPKYIFHIEEPEDWHPAGYSPGKPSEAVHALEILGSAILEHPEFMGWMSRFVE